MDTLTAEIPSGFSQGEPFPIHGLCVSVIKGLINADSLADAVDRLLLALEWFATTQLKFSGKDQGAEVPLNIDIT